MKKHLLALLLLLAAAPAVRAQDWLESLKQVATAAADKAADGKLTQYAIVGTWEYARPGVRFESDDLTSELGAAAVQGSVQEKLVRAYELAGIRPGACTFAFERDGRFTATAGSRTLAGTYAFVAATHEIVLDIERKSGRTLSVPGHAYLSGSGLQLVFPVTKLVETIEAFGSKVPALEKAAALLERYRDVYLGFEFDRN